MASLSKTYEQQKLLGQVYTPAFIVDKMLDEIGFSRSDLLGKTILDPACGDGRFLEKIVERILVFSKEENLAENLACVHGWDIDESAISLCISNLDTIVASKNLHIDWNIKVANALEQLPQFDFFSEKKPRFDFIVGNPPYIRVQHLEATQRSFIQANYTFCKSGSTDIYFAFYELALALLAPFGVASFITPNTFFYTETGKKMRETFENQACIRKITNYGDIQVFDNATTYSAILTFDKQKHTNFCYEQAIVLSKFVVREIDIAEIKGQKIWQLSIEKQAKITGKKLKDVCKIHVGITTLCDKAFIFSIDIIDDKFAWIQSRLKGQVKIERGILKPIIKGSLLKKSDEAITQYVLFPYQKKENKHTIILETDLKAHFPLAYDYLLSVKEDLDKRDAGKKNTVAWYAFGRNQGLDTSFGRKIIFSPMNAKPNFILSENEICTLYSGYCIKYDGNMDKLLAQLNSQRLADFIAVSSRDFRGGWKAYNKKTLEEFVVEEI